MTSAIPPAKIHRVNIAGSQEPVGAIVENKVNKQDIYDLVDSIYADSFVVLDSSEVLFEILSEVQKGQKKMPEILGEFKGLTEEMIQEARALVDELKDEEPEPEPEEEEEQEEDSTEQHEQVEGGYQVYLRFINDHGQVTQIRHAHLTDEQADKVRHAIENSGAEVVGNG
jgi:hypothetical protein